MAGVFYSLKIERMSKLFLDQKYLFTPGPTPIPNRVNQAMSRPMIGHRVPEFSDLLQDVSTRLKPVFGSKNPVYVLAGSGTAALETAVVNTVAEGDHVVAVVAGAFGDRFASILETYGVNVDRLNIEWGEACTPDKLEDFLKNLSGDPVKAVFATFNETSTGVLNPIHELGAVVKRLTDALFIVDGVSCIGGVPVDMEDDHIDVLVTGSQKALMLPPGLAFITFSDQAKKVIENCPTKRFYLDLNSYIKSYTEQTSTPFTPAISLIAGAQEVCNLFEEEGWDNVIKRHLLLKDMTREGLKAIGLPLLTDDAVASPTVTAVKPEAVAAPDLQKTLKSQFSIDVAGGQKKLKGKIIRIGHLGYCTPFDVLKVLSAIELALVKLGQEPQLGRAVQKAEEVWSRHV